jgi:hypothetical protein
MGAWLKLQNEVNALIDSTAADNTDQMVRARVCRARCVLDARGACLAAACRPCVHGGGTIAA